MYLPTDYDNTYCYYCPYTCKSCKGTYNNPICTSCKDGYELSGGKCLKNCIIGSNEKCKICNNEPGKIDRCLECNEGYYLPNDDYDYLVKYEENEYSCYYNRKYYHICEPCNIKGCEEYKPNSDSCIYTKCNTTGNQQIKNNGLNSEIISCFGGSDIGELEKCK